MRALVDATRSSTWSIRAITILLELGLLGVGLLGVGPACVGDLPAPVGSMDLGLPQRPDAQRPDAPRSDAHPPDARPDAGRIDGGVDASPDALPPGCEPEVCNHRDDDCNGAVDDAPDRRLCPSDDLPFCVEGACVACRVGGGDCTGDMPLCADRGAGPMCTCEAGSCRSEGRFICDQGTGQCELCPSDLFERTPSFTGVACAEPNLDCRFRTETGGDLASCQQRCEAAGLACAFASTAGNGSGDGGGCDAAANKGCSVASSAALICTCFRP